MKMLSKWILIFGLLGLILTGCGTTKVTDETNNGSSVSNNEEQNNQGKEEQTTEENNAENEARPNELQIEYQVNGMTKQDTASLQESDNQHYSMYVLPAFELTPEEPNKDVVFLSDNGQTFMRVELVPADVDWSFLTENTKALLEAVNSDVQTLEAPNEEFYKEAVVMEATNNNDVVTAYLIKNSTQPLKLTIFTHKDMDYRDAFLNMAKTIRKNQ